MRFYEDDIPRERAFENKFTLYSTEQLVEDSFLNSCFSGKFMVISKCTKCDNTEYTDEDFLSLNFDAFQKSQIGHIKELRENIGAQHTKNSTKWGFLKVFNFFDQQLKQVTLYDYINNLINYNLIKTNESYFCRTCDSNSLADKLFKLFELPNALILTIAFKDEEGQIYLPLSQFMEIDFTQFIEERFYSKNVNPLSFEKDSFCYELNSVVIYTDSGPCFECYTTFVKDEKTGKWKKFSRYGIEMVDKSVIEQIEFPYLMIYQRKFSMNSARSNLYSQLKLQKEMSFTDLKPIPDHWIQRAIYLHSPGKMYISHHLCEHLKLRPCYRDVYVKIRRDYEIDGIEQKLFFEGDRIETDNEETDIPRLNRNNTKGDEENNQQVMICNYTVANIEAHSTYIPTPIAEYIVEEYAADISLEDYKKADLDNTCTICLRYQKQLLKRRLLEKRLIVKYEKLDSAGYFAIDSNWIFKWRIYIFHDHEDDKFMKKYFFDSFMLPDKISNSKLINEYGEINEDLTEDEVYYVKEATWEILSALYYPDATIGRVDKSLSSEEYQFNGGIIEEKDLKLIEELKHIFNNEEVSPQEILDILEQENEEDDDNDIPNNEVLQGITDIDAESTEIGIQATRGKLRPQQQKIDIQKNSSESDDFGSSSEPSQELKIDDLVEDDSLEEDNIHSQPIDGETEIQEAQQEEPREDEHQEDIDEPNNDSQEKDIEDTPKEIYEAEEIKQEVSEQIKIHDSPQKDFLSKENPDEFQECHSEDEQTLKIDQDLKDDESFDKEQQIESYQKEKEIFEDLSPPKSQDESDNKVINHIHEIKLGEEIHSDHDEDENHDSGPKEEGVDEDKGDAPNQET